MEEFTNSVLHLACVAGPDTGKLQPLTAQWRGAGRGVGRGGAKGSMGAVHADSMRDIHSDSAPTGHAESMRAGHPDSARATALAPAHAASQSRCGELRDRLTSRQHFQARVVRRHGQAVAQLQDCGSANGTFRLRPLKLVPGARPSWWFAARSAHPLLHLRPGQHFLAGSNVWQVRTLPSSVSLPALASRLSLPAKTRAWRWWFFLFPLISLTWLASRWLPLTTVVAGLIAALLATWYLRSWYRHRTRGHPDPASFALAAHLPPPSNPTARRSASSAWELNLTPAPDIAIYGRRPRLVRARRGRARVESVRPGSTVGLRNPDPAWAEWICLQIMVQTHNQGSGARLQICHEGGRPTWRIRTADEPLVALRHLAPALANAAPVDHMLALEGQAPTVDLAASAWLDTGSGEQVNDLPSAVTLDQLDALSSAEEGSQSGMDAAIREPENARGLSACIGIGTDGPVTIDLVKDGPHALVAGTTGSGKSEALRTWLLQLVRRYPPSALRLILIDYKGGATLAQFASLPHSEGLFTDLDVAATGRVLHALGRELRRREGACVTRGVRDISQWEQLDPAGAPPRLLCVIDEFRALTQTHPQLMDQCVDLAARGRSLGMHLIAATQSPAGVVSPQMRANLTLRVCLRTAQGADSFDVLGVDSAAHLPRVPGRALVDAGMSAEPVQWALAPSQMPAEDGETGYAWPLPPADRGVARGLRDINQWEANRIWRPPLDAATVAQWLAQRHADGDNGGRQALEAWPGSARAAAPETTGLRQRAKNLGEGWGPSSKREGLRRPLQEFAVFAVGECHRSGELHPLDLRAPVLVAGAPAERAQLLDEVGSALGFHLRVRSDDIAAYRPGPAPRMPYPTPHMPNPAPRMPYPTPHMPNPAGITVSNSANRTDNPPAGAISVCAEDLVGTVLALRAAAREGVAIVIDDLPQWWRRCDDQWGVGSGRKLWEQITRAHPVVIAGSALEEAARMRQFGRVVISAHPREVRQCGWDRPVAEALEDAIAFANGQTPWVAVKWDERVNLRVIVPSPEEGIVSSNIALNSRAQTALRRALACHALADILPALAAEQEHLSGGALYYFPGAHAEDIDLDQLQAVCARHGFSLQVVAQTQLLANARKYRRLRHSHVLVLASPSPATCRELDLPLELRNECPLSQLWLVCRDESYRLSHLLR